MPKKLGLAPDIETEGLRGIEQLTGDPIRVEQYNYEASLDSIRHYALGIGDDNPLWTERAYAARTSFGDVLAPPTFLYSVFDGAVGAGLPGVQPVYAGTVWTFHRRIRRGDSLDVEASFGKVRRLRGRTAGDIILQDAESRYSAAGELAAEATASTFRLARRSGRGGLSYEPRDEYEYTAAELRDIRRVALNEYRRGPDVLKFDQLSVGDAIPTVVKGPIDRITMTAYYAGCIGSPGYKACEIAWKYRDWAENDPQRLPSNYDPSYFAETVLPSLGHQDEAVAREIGMPNAYDNGPQRCGWFGHVVTNWMGDHAFMRQLEVRLRRPDIFGDTIWIGGQIESLQQVGRVGVVNIHLGARNQLGDEVAIGSAKVLCHRAEPDRPFDPTEIPEGL